MSGGSDSPSPSRAGAFGGVRVFWDALALEKTTERLFPVSHHRSQRIHKKLLKKHGGEFRMKPCMWRVGNDLIAHPSLKPDIERMIGAQP